MSTRRRKPAVSGLKVAEQLLVANAVTSGMFGTGLKSFVTGRTGTSTIYNPNVADSQVTLPEILGIDQMGFKSGQPAVFKQVDAGIQMKNIQKNLKANALPMAMQVVGIPIAFRMARKVLGKSLINPTNKLIRDVGIKEVKL